MELPYLLLWKMQSLTIAIIMSKKKLLTITVTIICLLILVFYYANGTIPSKTDDKSSSNNSPQETSTEILENVSETIQSSPSPILNPEVYNSQNENIHQTMFVVPENPLGTIGTITALIMAFGVFALNHRKNLSEAA